MEDVSTGSDRGDGTVSGARRRVEVLVGVRVNQLKRRGEDRRRVAVVAVQHGGTAGDGHARLGEGKSAGVDRLLTVADEEQAIRRVPDEGVEQLEPDTGEVLDLVRDDGGV